MPVRIRLKRVGARNHPVFRIVVADGRTRRDGKCIEELGTYHPQRSGEKFTLNLDRARYWISQGAKPSDTVSSFIKKAAKALTATPAEESEPKVAAPAAPAPAPATPAPAPAPVSNAPAETPSEESTEAPAEKPASSEATPPAS